MAAEAPTGEALQEDQGGGKPVRQDRETLIQKEEWVERVSKGDERGNDGNVGISKGNLALRALLRFNTSKLFGACKQ